VEKYLVIETFDQLVENIKRFNVDLLENDSDFIRFLSQYRQWYYLDELDLFGPSKFIGYRKMTAEKYKNKKGKGADGRATEAVISKWFVEVENEELMDKLERLLSKFGKKPSKLAKLNVLKSSSFF